MKILSVETSGKICAVAITENERLIKEKIVEDENTHSVKLMPLIDEILKETNIQINDIDLFSCDIGPGSFTGIRIGVATIKAFLDATNKKAVGVTSLECLAKNITEDGIICSLIDAKNDNVYCGFFEKDRNTYNVIDEFKFDNINNIIDLAKNINKKIFFIGNGSIIHKELIECKLNNNATISDDDNINKLNARNLAYIAFENANKATETEGIRPIYLRKSNAERISKTNFGENI